MKIKKYFFVFMFIVAPLYAESIYDFTGIVWNQKDKTLVKISKPNEGIGSFIFDSCWEEYGTRAVSDYTLKLVKNVLTNAECKIPAIYLRKMSEKGKQLLEGKIIHSCGFNGLHRVIFIDEDGLNRLPSDEQKFVLLREVLFVKSDYPARRLWTGFAVYTAFFLLDWFEMIDVSRILPVDFYQKIPFIKDIRSQEIENTITSSLNATYATVAGIVCDTLIARFLFRSQGLDCDKNAVQLLKNVDSGVQFLHRLQVQDDKADKDYSQWNILKKYRDIKSWLFDDEYTFEERIAALKVLKFKK